MDYLDIELLRLQGDRALADRRSMPRQQRLDHHELTWMVMVAVLVAIPSAASWFG